MNWAFSKDILKIIWSKNSSNFQLFQQKHPYRLTKNGLLRLCVDFQTFNNLIVKNKYFLLLVNEMFNRLTETKYFIELNLRNAYNLIFIAVDNE